MPDGRPSFGDLRLVVFDCDGTLVDSQASIIESMTTAWRAHALPDPAPEAVRRVVGLGLDLAIAALLPVEQREDRALVERLVQAYKDAFLTIRTRPGHLDPLYPGTRAALDALEQAGLLLGVATGKARRGLLATLDQHGLEDRFVTLQTADRAPSKPHPGMLLQAMEEAGAAPQETVLIGDTTFDMDMARNARVAGIGVDWGYHERDELLACGAVTVIDRFEDLPPALAGLGGPVVAD